MRHPVHFIPIVTTLVAIVFAIVVFRRYAARRSGPHLAWWGAGIALYGVGTATEAFVTLFGWNPFVFRAWYVAGALLGGAPLAQGTVYLLLSRKVANRLTAVLVPVVAVAAVLVFASPLDTSLAEPHRLHGGVLEWSWVRAFSPFINTYAFVFLVGGAVLSAVRYARAPATRHRFVGNVFIAVGALLPGIGGMATRMGHVEVLYVTELVGLVLIWSGYAWIVRAAPAPSRSRVSSASAVRAP